MPSQSLTLGTSDGIHVGHERSVIGSRPVVVGSRSRRALLIHAHAELKRLAQRQQATDMEPYRIVLRLLGALVNDGGPTPQVGDNGAGGVAVEWLVDGNLMRIDYEDETEILMTACLATGERVLDETITAWWLETDPAIRRAREFLGAIGGSVRSPVPLG